MGSLILAVRFLTIVPVPGREASGVGALGRAGWWFPAVGLLLGVVLAVLDRALSLLFPALLASLLTVTAWKIATGGIHLDGLADCLDGVGGGSPEHRLAIMRDSRIGVFGAVGLILAFLISLVALSELPGALRWRALLLAPTVGRLAPVLLGRWFAPATPGHGSGALFLGSVPVAAGPVNLALAAALAALLLGPWGSLVPAVSLGAVAAWTAFVASQLGGLTGDALGSSVELAELATLLGMAALAHVGKI